MKITFLGGGNMAGALVGGLLNNGFPANDIVAIEIEEEKRERLQRVFSVRCFAEPGGEALACDALVLAVKPQQMHEACLSLLPFLEQQLVISIAAGMRLKDLSRWLGGYDRLVRAMPNSPALIGAGVTGLYALPGVSEAERLGAERIMHAVGSTLWVNDETQIDALTAISGSGPAYVFLFIEAVQQAATEFGFSPRQVRQLSIETILGATRLASLSDEPASVLRERVTSKGGTTEAALRVMTKREFREAVIAGIKAAKERGSELGELFGKE
ncbi:MAG: pyrroline-5-carboxylate reductase [Candidatus Accumulibacter sp.]|jgi:pyrroline-5-carboxylate reductase|nr:pyrroline-5-carboxylate reductase [Accumulibacter sp.]